MSRFNDFGNALYTGQRSIDFVGKRRIWYLIAAIAILASIVVPILRGGYHFSIEFTGGSEFTVSSPDSYSQAVGSDAVKSVIPTLVPEVSKVGANAIQVDTENLPNASDVRDIQVALAKAYGVSADKGVSASFIGPTWGAGITTQAITSLVVFVILVALVMAIYFRTWKMSLAAIVALFHDMILTAGVYGIVGFQVSPAAVIGFLTILGYSLYDTVVVFDKIRESTGALRPDSPRTFSETVNLAVNQTLVRSINTSVVALLPIAAILFIGSTLLGAGTLRDISLALFIGIIAGTYSTIFIAAPLYTDFRRNEPAIKIRSRRVLESRGV